MSKTELNNILDCENLSSDEINFAVKNLISNGFKTILLKNANGTSNLLTGLKASVKIEIIGDVGSDFANNVKGLKIIINGNIGDNSGCGVENTKFTVFGSCSSNFGNDAKSSEFYILESCGKNSFCDLKNNSKVVIGNQANNDFAASNNGGTIVILNLSGGSIFIEDDWFKDFKGGNIYFRADKNKIKIPQNKFLIKEIDDNDEDIYLPLISEFARLFNYSLSEIKSKPFCKVVIGGK